ncbi:MAG TPA: methionine synthase, partial [Thermodesulfobacteriota bacterium]|nr:methionine synthase [Thermodesulfobacteriota bacterium]
WSLLLRTKADIINFDAWSYFDRFSIYREAISGFLSRGGILAWGIVPTSEFTGAETLETLKGKFENSVGELARIVDRKVILERSILTPSCGMALMPLPLAEKAMRLLGELSRVLRGKYFTAESGERSPRCLR